MIEAVAAAQSHIVAQKHNWLCFLPANVGAVGTDRALRGIELSLSSLLLLGNAFAKQMKEVKNR